MAFGGNQNPYSEPPSKPPTAPKPGHYNTEVIEGHSNPGLSPVDDMYQEIIGSEFGTTRKPAHYYKGYFAQNGSPANQLDASSPAPPVAPPLNPVSAPNPIPPAPPLLPQDTPKKDRAAGRSRKAKKMEETSFDEPTEATLKYASERDVRGRGQRSLKDGPGMYGYQRDLVY